MNSSVIIELGKKLESINKDIFENRSSQKELNKLFEFACNKNKKKMVISSSNIKLEIKHIWDRWGNGDSIQTIFQPTVLSIIFEQDKEFLKTLISKAINFYEVKIGQLEKEKTVIENKIRSL